MRRARESGSESSAGRLAFEKDSCDMGCVGRDSFGTRTSSTTLLGRVPVVPASEGAADPRSSRARPAWQLPTSPHARPPWGVRVPESPSGWMSENVRPRRGRGGVGPLLGVTCRPSGESRRHKEPPGTPLHKLVGRGCSSWVRVPVSARAAGVWGP